MSVFYNCVLDLVVVSFSVGLVLYLFYCWLLCVSCVSWVFVVVVLGVVFVGLLAMVL